MVVVVVLVLVLLAAHPVHGAVVAGQAARQEDEHAQTLKQH